MAIKFRNIEWKEIPDWASIHEALSALEQLPTIQKWNPKAENRASAYYAVRFGIQLCLLGGAYLNNPLLVSLAEEFVEHGKLSPSSEAELTTLALLAKCDANVIATVPRTNEFRTPDFAATWQDGHALQIECTHAELRDSYFRNYALAGRVAASLTRDSASFDAHISHDLTDMELREIAQRASLMEVGDIIEEPSRYRLALRAEAPSATGMSLVFRDTKLPAWWPPTADSGLYAAASITIGNGQFHYSPTNYVYFPFEHKNYLNPVKNKAEHFQGSEEAPWLLALDASQLPDFTNAFRARLFSELEMWPRITGVLAFRQFLFPDFSHYDIKCALYVNPKATHQLPKRIVEILKGDGTVATLKYDLRPPESKVSNKSNVT